MHYKSCLRFGKLCGWMILAVFLLSGLSVQTGCAQLQSAMTGSPDLKQGTIPDLQSSAGPEFGKNYLTFLQMIDTETGWACTPKAVLRTVDGGESWTDVTPREQAGQAEGQGAPSAGSANMEKGKLWLVSRDGGQTREIQELPELPIVPTNISWSPAESILKVQEQGEIWLVPAKGKPYQVHGTETFSGLSSWSPDGKSLACCSEPALSQEDKISEERRMIFNSYNLDTGRLTRTKELKMPAVTGTLFAAWQPDGQGVLYWPDPAYSASLAADGLELQSLRWGESQPQVLPCGLAYRHWLSFFPDGRLLMVAGGGRSLWSEKRLAVCETETGNTKILPNPAGSVATDPAPSPDGKQIAFVAAQNLGKETGGFKEPGQLAEWVATRRLWLENSDGSGAHPLKAAGGGIYQPSWSQDGSAILYIRDNSLWLVEVKSEKAQRIIGPFPDWSKDLFGYYGYVWHDDFAWFSK
ncbi:periplasmic component of the Tol biopolymer transport system [Desulfosporosinus orientis DSM 765]|uniref:Periplasmic component of the Tol biopolymer transport system n=1 Tax=Desulfosporosinus orientis (strain ATCC 19365 / DSM 765 / NCIMB 8382 / VKM B-1628 / Singapore I) TaxID=768706 RepID=G7W8T4_DESOD|nr:PD40 domain-containing protein [Desulfosporosinus orientis]AET67794.1 periplasmic component of the Tol biopolymer transport system [Desulfosporosinus orientis DSM 765]